MRFTECLEQGTQKSLSKKLFVMQSGMGGGWKSVEVMFGGKFIAQIMTRIAGVGNFALPVSGVRQPAPQIIAGKFDEWSITVLRVRLSSLRVLR
jgi:hypothetical protein